MIYILLVLQFILWVPYNILRATSLVINLVATLFEMALMYVYLWVLKTDTHTGFKVSRIMLNDYTYLAELWKK